MPSGHIDDANFGREPRKEQRIGAAALSGIGKHFERRK
jgi:hypothetical protein